MITKHITLLIWVLILLGISAYGIKQLIFRSRKIKEINTTQGIYLAATIISAGIVLKTAMENVVNAYDNCEKIAQGNFFLKFVQAASSISVVALLCLALAIYTAKFMSTIFIGNRDQGVEFEADNKVYSLVQGTLLIVTCLLFKTIVDPILATLIPTITIPNLYH